jgi:hypothetical protein
MRLRLALAALIVPAMVTSFAGAVPSIFTTDGPDGKMGMASQPDAGGAKEIEAADDFILNAQTQINGASFTGLITGATPAIGQVDVEIYRVFPQDSDTGRTPNVPTRVNSPSDNAFDQRGTDLGNLSFNTMVLNANFMVANTVVTGINKSPGQTTGGEGANTGAETQFGISFTIPLTLSAGHYFFVPQVQVLSGQFLWLSSPKPIVGGTQFSPDLQAWIRNSDLDPDWLRVGTDIVGGTTPPTFNGTFSLSGQVVVVPLPAGFWAGLVGLVLALAAAAHLRKTTIASN